LASSGSADLVWKAKFVQNGRLLWLISPENLAKSWQHFPSLTPGGPQFEPSRGKTVNLYASSLGHEARESKRRTASIKIFMRSSQETIF